MKWDENGWLFTDDHDPVPRMEVPGPGLPIHEFPSPAVGDDFDKPQLSIDFQWLRSPWPDELFSLTERPGHLRIFGRELMGSPFRQGLVARRQQSHCYSATTSVQFAPDDFQQMAGLICYYNSAKFHYFYISYDDTIGKHLRVMSSFPDQVNSDVFTAPTPIAANGPVELRVEVDFERLRFAFRTSKQSWTWMPEVFDASILSDEATAPGLPNFTGAFVGMCCQDTSGLGRPADFDYFEYVERDYQPHIEEL
jgi:xylan 1,4-beta-xylosidase